MQSNVLLQHEVQKIHLENIKIDQNNFCAIKVDTTSILLQAEAHQT